MITQETLFVLGAGASKPYGFPTGKELRAYVCQDFPNQFSDVLSKDRNIHSKVDRLVADAQDLAKKFKSSNIPSIDQFLALSPRYSSIGKQAIIMNILRCEHNSAFGLGLNEESQSQDWYSLLYARMTEGLSSPADYEKFGQNKISFITFNYDRSLEHFLYTSLLNSFGESDKLREIASNVRDYIPFPFIHIYGQVDQPVWLGGVDYAPDLDYPRIEQFEGNIKLIGERTKEQKEEISRLFLKAERIFFLGFGYAPENMEAMGFPLTFRKRKSVYGTAKAFTKKEREFTTDTLGKSLIFEGESDIKPQIVDSDCYRLLRDFLR